MAICQQPLRQVVCSSVKAIDDAGAGAIGGGMEPVLRSLLPLVPLGGLAGLLSGLLGIGGGLVFSPLLLIGFTHQLARSFRSQQSRAKLRFAQPLQPKNLHLIMGWRRQCQSNRAALGSPLAK